MEAAPSVFDAPAALPCVLWDYCQEVSIGHPLWPSSVIDLPDGHRGQCTAVTTFRGQDLIGLAMRIYGDGSFVQEYFGGVKPLIRALQENGEHPCPHARARAREGAGDFACPRARALI